MLAPSRNLERTRGRILAESESLRLASNVQVLESRKTLGLRIRGKAVLALTDCRLLLASTALRAKRVHLLREWPAGGVRITITRPKLGNHLIHVVPGDGGDLLFEWLGGHQARSWATYPYRHHDR